MFLTLGVVGVSLLATADGTSDFLPPQANYGIIGALVMALISQKFVVPKWTYDKESARADRAEAENARLHQLIEERSIPALTEATLAVKDSQAWAADMKRELDRLRESNNRRGNDGS